MATAPKRYVDPPVSEPYRFGLFSVAAFPPVVDHVENGVEYQPLSCGLAHTLHDPCGGSDLDLGPGETGTPGTAEKDIEDGLDVVGGDPFTVYAGFSCRLVGTTPQGAQEAAEAAMLRGEQRAVEYTFWTGAEDNYPRLAAGSDVEVLTTGGAVGPTAALSLIEDWLGQNYYGTGVVHAPRGLAPYLDPKVKESAGKMRTALGTLVAFGGGYGAANTDPDGDDAAAGHAWMYVTGAVNIWRSEVFFNPTPASQGFNKQTNEIALIAERTYVLGTECILAAVEVDLGACPCP